MGYTGNAVTEDRVRATTGMTHEAIFYARFPDLADEQIKALQQRYHISQQDTVYKTGGTLYPHVKDTLAALSLRYTLFIVSNCGTGYIETFLDLNKLHTFFAGHQCFGTKGNPKADNIRDVISDNTLRSPVYVGDTLMDQRFASRHSIYLCPLRLW